MKKWTVIICFCVLLNQHGLAQIGGSHAFAFSTIESSARIAGIGGLMISPVDKYVETTFQNPAVANPLMHQQAVLNYTNYFNSINNGYAGYAHHVDSIGTFFGNIQYFNYGKFDGRDEAGAFTKEFTAADYHFQVGFAMPYKDFRIGASFNFLYSALEAYVGTAGSFNLGAIYEMPDQNASLGLTVQQLGSQLIRFYDDGEFEPLPFDVQLAFSKKLEHNPLRFHITAHHLHRWNISYVNTNSRNQEIDLETGEVKEQEIAFGDNLMRHFNFGAELLFSPNFQLRMGYNDMRRKELSPEERRGMTGFSWGFSIGIKKYDISYGSGGFTPGIGTNYFTVSRNISDFKKG
jgi:hypothetical protein